MAEYVARPKPTRFDTAIAAVYRFGEPLDELRKVARTADSDAAVVEVPEWKVLLVRHEEVPDHGPLYVDYDVVEDGQMLIYSRRADVLYVDDVADFEREWQHASNEDSTR